MNLHVSSWTSMTFERYDIVVMSDFILADTILYAQSCIHIYENPTLLLIHQSRTQLVYTEKPTPFHIRQSFCLTLKTLNCKSGLTPNGMGGDWKWEIG